MRLMVRRLYSPLMASNPRPMAINGIRNPRIEANDGKGAWALVNRRKNTNGSDDVVWRMPCRAPYSAATAVSTTSHSSTRMRALDKWSASSLSVTAANPLQGEPSRCMNACLLDCRTLEMMVVDGIQAGFPDG